MVKVKAGVVVFLLGCILLLGMGIVVQRSQMNMMLGKGYEKIAAANKAKQGKRLFIDPMHPWITSDKPGSCPICGMELIEVSAEQAAAMQAAAKSGVTDVSLPPQQRVVGNVALEEVMRMDLAERISAFGEIVIPDNATDTETSWVSGRIEKMHARTLGGSIAAGAPMLELYSEDLVSAQQEYLVALKAVENMEKAGYPEVAESSRKLAASSERKMRLLGMTKAQISELAKSGKVRDKVTVYAKYGGKVMAVYVDEGAYVPSGGMIMQVARLNPVWADLHIYEADQDRVAVGDEVKVTGAGLPVDGLTGRIFEIKPSLEETRRTLIARVSLPNPGGKLKPGTYIDAEVLKKQEEAPLVVTRNAVLVTGKGARVWIASNAEKTLYEPRAVEIGRVLGDNREYYEIISGLNEHDHIVSGAVFLVDSEAQLLSARQSGSGAEAPGTGEDKPAQEPPQHAQ